MSRRSHQRSHQPATGGGNWRQILAHGAKIAARTGGTGLRQNAAEIREKWRKLNEKRMLPAKRNIRIEWAVLDLNQ